MIRARRVLFLMSVLSLLASGRSLADESSAPAAPGASPAELLPIYGVDLPFDAAMVDGASVPSGSPAHPHQGLSDVALQRWSRLRASGFNVVRFEVDLSQGEEAARRLANLCLWAAREGISLMPVLVAEPSAPFSEALPSSAAALAKNTVASLGQAGPEAVGTYARVLMYQLGRELNHPGRNGRIAAEDASRRQLEAAVAVRAAEAGSLSGTGLLPTPLLAVGSVDAELIRVGAAASGELDESTYSQAEDALRQALAPLATAAEIDAVAVSWFPGSVSAGGVERIAPLLQGLASALVGKQLVAVTGFSTAFRSEEEQKQFTALAFANLAEARAGVADSPLLGVVFSRALDGEVAGDPPAGFDETRHSWSAPDQSAGLLAHWRGEPASPAIEYWSRQVDTRLGLLVEQPSSSSAPTFTPKLALLGFEKLAGFVAEATPPTGTPALDSTTQPTGDTPAGPESPSGESKTGQVLEAVGGVLGTLLDQVLVRLGDELVEELDEELDEQLGGDEAAAEGATGDAQPALRVVIAGASCSPANPKVDEPISCFASLRNESSTRGATGLSVALLDEADYLLGDETMVEGISLAALAQASVTVPWKPVTQGAQSVRVKVYDSAFQEIAAASAGTVTVSAGSKKPPPKLGVAPARFPDRLVDSSKSSVLKPARPGFPSIGTLAVTTQAMSQKVDSVALPVANSSTRSLSGFRAELHVDGRKLGEQSVRSLLPGQSTTVTFRELDLAPTSAHSLRVVLSRADAQPLLAGALEIGATTSTRPAVRPISTARNAASLPRVRPPVEATRAAKAPTTRTTATTGTRTPVAEKTTPKARPVVERSPGLPPRERPPMALARPDLALSSSNLQQSPTTAAAGATIEVRATVSNLGSAASAGGQVTFVVRGARGQVATSGRQAIAPLAARSKAVVSWSFKMPAGSSWRLEARLESSGDANAANDSASVPIVAAPPPRQLRARPSSGTSKVTSGREPGR